MNTNLKVPSLQSLVESDRGSNDSLLADSLQLDIEELDDEEYSIPALDSLPTLENVLIDMADAYDSENTSDFGFTSPRQSATASEFDTPSMLGDTPHRMGTILRHVTLQGVSAQIASAADRINAGLATCMAISRPMTAIGTSHGHVLAFDAAQALRWCWSAVDSAAQQQGAVAALAFNADSTRLLAGFARGLLIMIDTGTGDMMRSMPDLITPNTGVLNLAWTELPTTALCSDSGGSVWTLNFTRRLGIRGAASRCIFSGARGEVCTMAPLCFAADTYADHPLRAHCIAALATLTKFVVVTVRPRLRVIKYRPLAGPPDSLPLLAWHMVLIQTGSAGARTVDPVLCAAHGRSVYFHQLCQRDGRLHLLYLRHIAVGYDLLALHWLGPKTIATLDTGERLHLHDIRADRELEAIDMAAAGLVYASAQFKAHATGGNVSPALALAGTYACYNSVVVHDNRVFILGARAMHSVSVRAWAERVAHLVQHGRWTEACALAVDGWRSAVDGAMQRPERMEHARGTVRWLVDEYLITGRPQAEIMRTAGDGLEAMIECLVSTGETELLWSELWDRYAERPERYLRALTQHIEGGAVRDLAPVVAQALCTYWQRIDPERLEQLVLVLDWRCLDLHQVLTAVRREKLWQAQIYLNANALGDYCASLVDLVPLVLEEDRRLGNYLLVYVSSCLAGRGYPRGEIAENQVATVKHEVLRCLTAVHSNGAPDTELPYPYLRTLLRFDTRDTLNVLSLAFEEKEFSGPLGQSHRQRFVHILLEIMTPNADAWPEIGSLLNFIAQQIATRSLPVHGDRELLDRVMVHLKRERIDNESAGQHAEREHAWLELLANDCLTHITMGDQLRSARAARCFRVVQLLLERRRCYDDILPCYLDAGQRAAEMWTYMRRWAHNDERQIFAQLYTHLEQLLRLDSAALARLLIECYANRMDEVLKLLVNDETATFELMQQLDAQRYDFASVPAEQYLRLLCKHATPERVLGFLQRCVVYRLEVALETVRAHGSRLSAALVYLYERRGDYDAAFAVCMGRLAASESSSAHGNEAAEAQLCARELSELCQRASEVLAPSEAQRMWFAIIDAMLPRSDLAVCTRSVLHAASRYVDLSEMVQRIMEATPALTAADQQVNGGGIANGNGGGGHVFGDIRHILVGMLSNAKYEMRLLRGTAQVLGSDLHTCAVRARRKAARPLHVACVTCVVCDGRLVASDSEVLLLGGCGHAVHCECWPVAADNEDEAALLTSGTVGTVRCPRCGIRVATERGEYRPPVLSPDTGAVQIRVPTDAKLQVEAPPRIGIGIA